MTSDLVDLHPNQKTLPPSDDEGVANELGQALDTISPVENWYEGSAPTRRWTVPDYVPHGNVTILGGDGGLGKTLLAQQLLASTSLGRPWIGLPTVRCITLGVFCEDEANELWRRQEAINRDLDCSMGDLENIHFLSRVTGNNILLDFARSDQGSVTPFFHMLERTAQNLGAQLVVLDSLHDLFAGNENHRGQARQFINLLRALARRINGSVVLNAHPSQAGLSTGSGSSGSTAWNNAVRSRLYLDRVRDDIGEDPDARWLRTKKSNYAASGGELRLRYQDGVFIRPDEPSGMMKTVANQKVDRIFLEGVVAATKQGRAISESKQASNFAPRVIAQMKLAQSVSQQELTRAMGRLFDANKICVGNPVVGSDRHSRRGIAIVQAALDVGP